MATPFLIADAAEVAIMSPLAEAAFGSYDLQVPEGINIEDIHDFEAPGNELGYVARLSPQRATGIARRFIRADVAVTAKDDTDPDVIPESDVDRVLSEAESRVESEFFLESDITKAGLGAWVPYVDFNVGDIVNVRIFDIWVKLPVTRIEPIISEGDIVDWRVHVGGQLLSNDQAREVENATIQKELIQDRRDLAGIDAKATKAVKDSSEAKSTAGAALDAVNDADGVIQGHVKSAREYSEESHEHSEASQQHSADAKAYSDLSHIYSQQSQRISAQSVAHSAISIEYSEVANKHSLQAKEYSQLVQDLQPAIEQAASDAQTASQQSSQYSAESKAASEQSSQHSQAATNAKDLSLDALRDAELARDAAETSRRDAEAKRDEAEAARRAGFAAMTAASAAMAQAEQSRAEAEEARRLAENERAAAEDQRSLAETARSGAESARDTAEQKRSAAESERALAESARDQAEQKRAAAETAREGAVQALQEAQAENQKRFDELEATQDELTTTIQKMQAESLKEKVNLWATDTVANSNTYWAKEASQVIGGTVQHRFTAKDTWRGEVVFTVEYTGSGSDSPSHTRHISAQIPNSSGSRQVLIGNQSESRSFSSALVQTTIFPGSQTTRKYNLSGQALSQNTWTTLQTITVPSGATGFNSFFRVHWGAAANSQYQIRITRNGTVVGTTYTVNGLGPITPLGNGARYMGMRRAVDTSAAGTYRFEVRTSAGLASQRATSKALVEASWIMP